MLTVSEATKLIAEHLWKPETELVPLQNSLGRVLAESVATDRDLPPYNRVAMDGIAIVLSAVESGSLRISGVASAGMSALKISSPLDCIEVMTGAILPEGADVVIRYEDVKIENGIANFDPSGLSQWMNVHRQGSDSRRGDVLLSAGTFITAAEIPLLASVGKRKVSVYTVPRTAVISTGDELVDIAEKPLDHQIRISNSYAVQAGLETLKVSAHLFHMSDQGGGNTQLLEKILNEHELIILSGGVSKGKFDWVPRALEQAGIKKHFHQVNQKPGKPLWFGTGSGKVVFALPGNPVSTFLCLYRYIIPWLRESFGLNAAAQSVQLMEDYEMKFETTYFLQVKIVQDGATRYCIPVPGGGSGDFVNLLHVDGFIEIPPGKRMYPRNTVFKYIPFRVS